MIDDFLTASRSQPEVVRDQANRTMVNVQSEGECDRTTSKSFELVVIMPQVRAKEV